MEETRKAPYFIAEDIISKLPVELIHYIMSFMDTKYAVQTCVLSKRWIHIWKSLPFLNFDRSSFAEDKKDKFIMFVDMVFNFHKEFDIQKVRMRWKKSPYDDSVTTHVNRWIDNAVKYNVQRVCIIINQSHDSAYEITQTLLNCKSLRKLIIKVSGNGRYANIILPGSMNLPQLKSMWLIGISISDVESSKRLFSSCPVLRSLRLVDCDIQTDNQRNLIVDSLSLKKFDYIHSHKHLLLHTMAKVIKLRAPNLEILTLRSFFKQDYSLENFSPKLRVRLYLNLKTKDKDENAERYSKLPSKLKDVYAVRMMKFVGAVYKVESIRSSPGFLEVLSQAPDILDSQPPCLFNLLSLKLDMWFTRGCLRAIAYLLKISPRIMISTLLDLFSKESNLVDVGDGWETGLSLPGMLSHLKYVRVYGVEGSHNELRFLSFLLNNAMVLEKVWLYPRPTIDSPDGLRKLFIDKLKALPKASSHIKMYWPGRRGTYLMIN